MADAFQVNAAFAADTIRNDLLLKGPRPNKKFYEKDLESCPPIVRYIPTEVLNRGVTKTFLVGYKDLFEALSSKKPFPMGLVDKSNESGAFRYFISLGGKPEWGIKRCLDFVRWSHKDGSLFEDEIGKGLRKLPECKNDWNWKMAVREFEKGVKVWRDTPEWGFFEKPAGVSDSEEEEGDGEAEEKGGEEEREGAGEKKGKKRRASFEPSEEKEKKKRIPFTEEEEEYLTLGVKMFGAGEWAKILGHYGSHFHPKRTNIHLKDKWRNMTK